MNVLAEKEGWVYVATMTNTVGVVKIGYSRRNPDVRVKEWSKDTGAPGEGKVEYKALVTAPEEYEKMVHKDLKEFRESESGEWFKCDVATAVNSIRGSGKPPRLTILHESSITSEQEHATAKKAEEAERLTIERSRVVHEKRIKRAQKEEEKRKGEVAKQKQRKETERKNQLAELRRKDERSDDRWATSLFILPICSLIFAFSQPMNSFGLGLFGVFLPLVGCSLAYWVGRSHR